MGGGVGRILPETLERQLHLTQAYKYYAKSLNSSEKCMKLKY